MLLFSAAQGWLPCSAVSAPCEFTADRPGSIIAQIRRRSMHDDSGIDQNIGRRGGGGGEVKLFRGGASWGRRGVLCFSTSEDSMQFISYTSPSHVEVFSRHAKDQPSPRGAGALMMGWLADRAAAHVQPSQRFGARDVQGRELHAPIPHRACLGCAPGIKSWPLRCSSVVSPRKRSQG